MISAICHSIQRGIKDILKNQGILCPDFLIWLHDILWLRISHLIAVALVFMEDLGCMVFNGRKHYIELLKHFFIGMTFNQIYFFLHCFCKYDN